MAVMHDMDARNRKPKIFTTKPPAWESSEYNPCGLSGMGMKN
jgi:hypothetical protein